MSVGQVLMRLQRLLEILLSLFGARLQIAPIVAQLCELIANIGREKVATRHHLKRTASQFGLINLKKQNKKNEPRRRLQPPVPCGARDFESRQ